MTHQSPTAMAGSEPNKTLPDALHAYAENGNVFIKEGGRFWLFDPYKAWTEWLWCASSPIPSTQERAREIRAVLDSTGYTYGVH